MECTTCLTAQESGKTKLILIGALLWIMAAILSGASVSYYAYLVSILISKIIVWSNKTFHCTRCITPSELGDSEAHFSVIASSNTASGSESLATVCLI